MNWSAEPLYAWFDAMLAPPEPIPEPEPTAWDVEKSRNRLQRQISRVESGKWMPRLSFRLNGKAVREYQAARELVQEAGQLIRGG